MREPRGALLRTPGHSRRFNGMLFSLIVLSDSGQPSDSRTVLRVLPDSIGDTTGRFAAQFRHIARISRHARPVRIGSGCRFPGMLLSPSHFGSRVSHQIQRHLLQSMPATRAIQQCASWRTQNDSSLFVVSRALGKVAASPPLFSGVPRRVRGRSSGVRGAAHRAGARPMPRR